MIFVKGEVRKMEEDHQHLWGKKASKVKKEERKTSASKCTATHTQKMEKWSHKFKENTFVLFHTHKRYTPPKTTQPSAPRSNCRESSTHKKKKKTRKKSRTDE